MDPMWVFVGVLVFGLAGCALIVAGIALYQVYRLREEQRHLWVRLEELSLLQPAARRAAGPAALPVAAARPSAETGAPAVAPTPSEAPQAAAAPVEPAAPAAPEVSAPAPSVEPVPQEKVAAFRRYVNTLHPAEVANQPAPEPPPAAEVPPASSIPPTPPPIITSPIPPEPPRPRRSPMSMEAWLGGRVLVWAAAILLAIGGIYLLQLSREILTPTVLVTIGALFGVALLGAGQWLRRNSYIAQGLSAAGIAVLFACVLAAVNFYRPALLNPTVGFVLMAIITALAVALSLQLGPLVAALGLIGGFLTPALMQTGEVRPGALFSYLFLLQAGLMAVTRRRGWTILAHLTLLGSMLWVLVFLAVTEAFVGRWNPEHGQILGLFLLGSVATFLTVTVSASAEQTWRGRALGARVLAWLATSVSMALVVLLLGLSHFDPIQWAFLGLLTLGCIALGRLRSAYENLAWIAATLVLLMLLVWGVDVQRIGSGPEVPRFAWIIGLLGGALAVAGYLCLWGAAAPLRWSVFAGAVTVVYPAVAYGVLRDQLTRPQWALLLVGVATLTAMASVPPFRKRDIMAQGAEAFAAFALATLALVALALMAGFREAWLTATWSLLVPVTAFLALRLRTPALLYGAVVLAACVGVRCLANPAVFSYPTGPSLFWNPIVYGYGIPLIAFAATFWLLRREPPGVATVFEVLPQALAFAFVTLMVRRGFHPANLAEESLHFPEAGTLTILWLLLGWASLAAAVGGRRTAAVIAGRILVFLGIANLAFSYLQIARTDWAAAVGTFPVFNLLLYVYGVPTALLLGMGIDLKRRGEELWAGVAHVAGVVALAGLLTLEVRHLHHRPNLLAEGYTFAEVGSYAVAWLVLGQVLLLAARRWATGVLRVEGLAAAVAGAAVAVLVAGVAANPRWVHWDVGSPVVFNYLLWTYGAPAGLLLALAYDRVRAGSLTEARAAGVAGLLLAFILVTLEVRQGFQGPFLDAAGAPPAEMWSYSLAWTLLGLAWIVVGLARGGLVLRWGGLLLILLTIGKALVVDAWQLQGVARVLLLIGLGLALFPLAYLYQRFFFARPAPAARPGAEDLSS